MRDGTVWTGCESAFEGAADFDGRESRYWMKRKQADKTEFRQLDLFTDFTGGNEKKQ